MHGQSFLPRKMAVGNGACRLDGVSSVTGCTSDTVWIRSVPQKARELKAWLPHGGSMGS
jgi:hypothetical protein